MNTQNLNNALPDALLDHQLMIDSLMEFSDLYSKRPILNNEGGMKIQHLFATWFMAKTLQPNTIIESGIWMGLGTWILETACPNAKIISLDLNLSKRRYISKKVEYHECDFSELDFRKIDTTNCLAFFDDHQNSLTRLQQCLWYGIKDVIFEDNFNPGEGDFYSMRMINASSGFGDSSSIKSFNVYGSLYQKSVRKIKSITNRIGLTRIPVVPEFSRKIIPKNNSDAHILSKNIKTYYEFPPVYSSDITNQQPPILDEVDSHLAGDFVKQIKDYNNICYVTLK